jgi:hypothetical protein
MEEKPFKSRRSLAIVTTSSRKVEECDSCDVKHLAKSAVEKCKLPEK